MEDFLKKEIIIIGAGMAGISAAFHLNKLGFTNVLVLEAQNRIGGRIHTVHMGSHFIEMGAQWIHGQKDNIIYNIASSNGLINEEVPSYMEKLEDFEFYPEERENILLLERYLYDKVENSPLSGIASKSVLAYFEDHFQKFLADQPQESVKDVLREAFNCKCLVECEVNGCKDLSLLSLSLSNIYKECEGNHTVELKYGYSKVLDVFLKNIPDGVILTNHKVTKVDWSELCSKSINTFNENGDTIQQSNVGKIKVFCSNNKEFLADHVIVTLPLGYLKKYSSSLFHPPLCEKKQQAIKCIGFDAVDKIYLNFEVPFWSEYAIVPVLWKKEFDEHFPINFDNKSSSPFWVKYINRFAYVLGHPNMLCAWITGEGAIKMETLDDTQVVDNCMKLLELLFQKKLPKPMNIVRYYM